MAVHAANVVELDVLGTFSCASTGVGAVSESEFVHLCYHGAYATVFLHLSLREERKLAHLCRHEEHGRSILASSDTCTTADAACRVHSLVGFHLGDGKVVGILSTAAVEADVAAYLLDLVERVAIDHKVFDDGESSRAPRLHRDCLSVLETTHVELASGCACGGGSGMAVDIKRAHAADTLAAVVVEHDGLLASSISRSLRMSRVSRKEVSGVVSTFS